MTPFGGDKDDALITQFFTLDSYANRRVAQRYAKDENGIMLVKDLFANDEWDVSIDKSIIIESMQKEIIYQGDAHKIVGS